MKRQKKEAKRHNDFLNSGFGLITFTFAFTCLGFKNTQKLALACLPVGIGLSLQERNHFPSTLKVIRVLEKETEDIHVIEVRKYLEGKCLGYKSI